MSVIAPIAAKAALDVERSQLGVAEQPPGSNDTPYGVWYGWNGVAWCDIFQTWALAHAGWADVPHFASTPVHAAWFQKNGAWLPKDATPPVGALEFFDWGEGIAHVGMFEGLLPDGRLSSLEGNTDSAGGGSGGRVMRQYRSRASIAGFGVITYQPAAQQEDDDDMDYVMQLSEDITYQGTPIPKGTAYHVVGQVLGHINPDELASLKGDGVKVVPAGPYRAISTFDKTTDNIHRLLKA